MQGRHATVYSLLSNPTIAAELVVNIRGYWKIWSCEGVGGAAGSRKAAKGSSCWNSEISRGSIAHGDPLVRAPIQLIFSVAFVERSQLTRTTR
jgi:hypothetical protein